MFVGEKKCLILLLVLFAVEAFKFKRPEGAAAISVAGGTFAVTPSFVVRIIFSVEAPCVEMVGFFSTHTANVNVHLVPVQLISCKNKISSK